MDLPNAQNEHEPSTIVNPRSGGGRTAKLPLLEEEFRSGSRRIEFLKRQDRGMRRRSPVKPH